MSYIQVRRPRNFSGTFGALPDCQGGCAGCWTGSNFVPSAEATFNFKPKPMSEIMDSKARIATLIGRIDAKSQDMETLGAETKEFYAEYLETKIEVCSCGPLGIKCAAPTEGVLSWVLGPVAWIGASTHKAYLQCLKDRNTKRLPLNKANQSWRALGKKRQSAYSDFAELLTYSPDIASWRELCRKKLSADKVYNTLTKEITKVAMQAQDKIIAEEKEQEVENISLDRTIFLLQALLKAIRLLLEAIEKVFKFTLKGVAIAAKFVAKHPVVFWIGAGVVGLVVVGAILRPYASIAAGAFNRLPGG